MATQDLRAMCQNAINRISNLGMTIKTTGMAFFGAGIAHLATTDLTITTQKQRTAYLIALSILAITFQGVEIAYLRTEKIFRIIDDKIADNTWEHNFLNPDLIRSQIGEYPKLKLLSLLRSFTIWPFIMAQILILITIFCGLR